MPNKAAANSYSIVALTVVLVCAGCGTCPPTTLSEAKSSDGSKLARALTYECGPMSPFNAHVALTGADRDSEIVLTLSDVPFEPHLKWESGSVLIVTIDCPAEKDAWCGVPGERHWEISPRRRRSGNVEIRYATSDRLRRTLPAIALRRVEEQLVRD